MLAVPMEFSKSYLRYLMTKKLAFVNYLQHIMLSGKKVMRVEMKVVREARPVMQALHQVFKQKLQREEKKKMKGK